jgi:uncharacterized membrane protein
MNNAIVYYLLTIGIPFVVALGVFGLLRERGARSWTSGIAAIVAGLGVALVVMLVVLVATVT